MKVSRFWKAAAAACIVALCVCGLAACSSNSSNGSGATAATVNGTEIKEQKVTDQIQQIRDQSGLADEESWGKFLVSNSMTAQEVRQQIIDALTEQELIMQGASELGVTVSDSEIDEYVNNMKANYDGDDAWNKALQQAGFTEETYRATLKNSLYQQKVSEYFEEHAEVTDEDIVSAAKTYASYYDGAKRSSHILFKVDDTSNEQAMAEATAKANEVLAQINAGTLDFADAARQYSQDTGSAANGGDVGWDLANSFVTEYTDALANLEEGQVSGLVNSTYGVHIIKVTEVYKAPEDTSTITSIDQIPEGFRDTIKDVAKSVKANSDYSTWLDDLKNKANIVVNDMPSGLPYDIDLTPYQSSSSSSTDSTATESAASESTTSESTSSESAASAASESSSGSEASSSSSSSAQ